MSIVTTEFAAVERLKAGVKRKPITAYHKWSENAILKKAESLSRKADVKQVDVYRHWFDDDYKTGGQGAKRIHIIRGKR